VRSPFIKAACGCIVIPLHRAGYVIGTMSCILVRPCDGPDGPDWCFHLRDMAVEKVTIKVGQTEELPRWLTEEETDEVIAYLNDRVKQGSRAIELADLLVRIGEPFVYQPRKSPQVTPTVVAEPPK
jgi:hypothetical protein